MTTSELFTATGLKKSAYDKLLGLMVAQKVVVKLPNALISHRRTVADFERRLVEFLRGREKAAVGEIKEKLDLTRKALIPLLEYFDEKGITVRAGNERRLRQRPASPA